MVADTFLEGKWFVVVDGKVVDIISSSVVRTMESIGKTMHIRMVP